MTLTTYGIPGPPSLKLEKGGCLDHPCIIPNFFVDDYSESDDSLHIIRYTKAGETKSGRTNISVRNLPIEEIVKRFLNWKADYSNCPTILHAHGFNNDTGLPAIDKFGNQFQRTWQALTRFHSNRNIQRLSMALEKTKESGVFLTLTVDRSKTLRESWETITKDWNRFVTRLKIEIKKAGGKHHRNLKYFGVLEAQSDGYPHIHVVFLGIRWLFYAGNKKDWELDNPHSKNLKHFWKRGSVFVNATKEGQTVRNPIGYIMKYIRKTMGPQSEDSKAVLTQALLWAFNRRSFFLSRSMSNWVKKAVPEKIKSVKFVLHGIAKSEFWTGQFSPLLRIVSRKLPPNHPALRPVITQMTDSFNGQSFETFEVFDSATVREQFPPQGELLQFYWKNKKMKLKDG